MTAGAAAPAAGAAVGGATAAGAGAGAAGAGTAAGLTAAEMGALGLTGAEIAAATPAMGATAGAGLGAGETIATGLAASPSTGIPLASYTGEAPFFNATALPETFTAPPAAGATFSGTGVQPSWLESAWKAAKGSIPSKETINTFGTYNAVGQLGNNALTPSPPRTSLPVPSFPSGSTRGYTPTATSPAQQLAQMMAARRQTTTGRRFS